MSESLLHLLRRATQSSRDLLANRLSGSPLTPRQLMVLMAIEAEPGASQTVLIESTGIDRSTIAEVCRRLVESGLVERTRSPLDARIYTMELTERGRALLEEASAIALEVDQEIRKIIGSEQEVALERSLKQIASALGPVASAVVSPRSKSVALMRSPGQLPQRQLHDDS